MPLLDILSKGISLFLALWYDEGRLVEKVKEIFMIEVGIFHQLKVVRETPQGIYLNDLEESDKDILLPKGQVPEGIEIGELIEVFVYRDSEDRKIATLKKPKLTIGELARLKVVSVNRIGAFLEWGLEKDLFLPFSEQTEKVHKEDWCLVGMYRDKSDRLCATMKIYELLQAYSPYKEKDEVSGTIYNIKEAFGAFVAVDNKYHGLIPIKELYGTCKVGDSLILRVSQVRPDGKLELSMRKPAHLQMEDDARKIMEALDKEDGKLKLHDKSSPEAIKEQLGMSKAGFKRAVGRLMKEGVIEIKEDGIYRNW